MVAIKHFGMPSCCDNCDIFNWTDKACHITYTQCENPFDNKNDDCPLIEVEPQSNSNKLKAYQKAFEDIRAEIETIIGERNLDDYDFCSGLICARKIIDKYNPDKAESEG